MAKEEKKETKEEKKEEVVTETTTTENSTTSSTETITGMEANKEAILVYLIPILGFVFSFLKDKKVCKEAKFHYNQSATSFIIALASGLLGAIPFIGWIVVAVVPLYDFVMRIIALVKAINGELYKIPGEYELTKAIWHTEE